MTLYAHHYVHAWEGIQTTVIETDIPLNTHLSLNCTTDLALISMEWLDSEGKVLVNTSEQHLTLEINRVTEAHHNTEYTCQIYGMFGNQNKSITLLVAQQSVASSASVGGAVAAVLIIVLLIAAGVVLTTIFIAKRYDSSVLLVEG